MERWKTKKEHNKWREKIQKNKKSRLENSKGNDKRTQFSL